MAWTTFVASTTIRSAEVNANFAYSKGDIVPHSFGTLANGQFNLGTTTARWLTTYTLSLNAATIDISSTATFRGGVLSGVAINHANASQTLDVRGNIYSVGFNTTSVFYNFADTGTSQSRSVWEVVSGGPAFEVTLSGNNVAGNHSVGVPNAGLIDLQSSGGSQTGILIHADLSTSVWIGVHKSVTARFMPSKVSIGHNNPSQTMDINGALYAAGTGRFSGNISGGHLNNSQTLDIKGNIYSTGFNTQSVIYAFADTSTFVSRYVTEVVSGGPSLEIKTQGNSVTGTHVTGISNIGLTYFETTGNTSLGILLHADLSQTVWIGAHRTITAAFTPNRVSIGHKSPSQTLDVNGAIFATTGRMISNFSAGHANNSQTVDIKGQLAIMGFATNGVSNISADTATNAALTTYEVVSGGPALQSKIFGNSATGTHVTGIANMSLGLLESSGVSSTGILIHADLSASVWIGAHRTITAKFTPNRVSIGHANPSQTLDVNGAIALSTAIPFVANGAAITSSASAGSVTSRINITVSGVSMWIECRRD